MTRRNLTIVVVIGAAAAAIGGALTGQLANRSNRSNRSPPSPPSIQGLAIDANALESGELWAAPDQTMRLPIRNTTDRTIRVTGLRADCECLHMKQEALTLAAKEEKELFVRVDLSPREPWQVGRTARFGEWTFRLIVQGREDRPNAWTVRRLVRAPISTDTPDVMFGESNRAGQPPVSRIVRVQMHVPGTLKVSVDTPIIAATLSSHAGEASVWTLTVVPRTDLAPGPYRATIALETVPPAHRLELPVDGLLVEGAASCMKASTSIICLSSCCLIQWFM